jgi:hypothetical protein
MALKDGATTRLEHAKSLLKGGTLEDLEKRFQVRLYRAGANLERIGDINAVQPNSPATRIGDAVKQIASEATSLPIGAVVLLTDGADNSGGIDLATISEIRRFRIPVHTVGFGPETPERDLEIMDAQFPQRTLADSKINGVISIRQYGFAGQRARLTLKDSGKVLASKEITLKDNGVDQTETVPFHAGAAGVRNLEVSVEPFGAEENKQNNKLTRLVNVDGSKPRVLYIEGEPKWEYKFIRRAIEQDEGLELVSILRTTQNKIYRQGIGSANELEQGFPATVDELFGFQAIIIGGVEANYFTPTQQELIRQFVGRGIALPGRKGWLGGWRLGRIFY